MKKFRRTSNLRSAFIAIVLALAIFFAARKVNEYSADPLGEKDCPPLSPSFTGDPSQANIIEVKTPAATLPWIQKGGTINDASCLNKTLSMV